jgi:dUTP pyrophosphatase
MSLLFFKKLTNNARIPSKENQNSPGYKLFSAYDSVVRRNSKQLIFLDLCISIPENYYGIIVSNINEGINITLNVISKIIESNSEQNIGVLVANYGDKDFTI